MSKIYPYQVFLRSLKRDMLLVASVCFLSIFYIQRDVLCDDNFSPRPQDVGGWNTSTLRNKRWVSGSGGCAEARKVGNIHLLSSPNFPREYGPNTRCEWRESAPSGCTYEITFTDFEVESDPACEYDLLEIFDGSSTSAVPLGKFCGNTLPPAVHSSTNEISIRFTSDGSLSYTGFALSLELLCNSGQSSTSVLEPGKQQCCGDGYAEKDDKCEECFCGNHSSCVFHAGEKVCICNKGYAQKDGKCEECNCGNSCFCVFEVGEKKCLCSQSYVQGNEKCKGYVTSIALVSVASAVLLLGLVYVTVRCTRLKKRIEDYDKSDIDRRGGIRFSETTVPYRKDPLM